MQIASGSLSDSPVLVLFRHDLRLADNRALHAAAESGKPVVAAFVLDETGHGARPLGGARRWWLHHSLERLADSLAGKGIRLVLRRGSQEGVVASLIDESGARLVLWNRRYDPPGMASDTATKAMLKAQGVAAESFDGHLLHEPWRMQTTSGGFYKVYSPFWKALASGPEPRAPLPAPKSLRPFEGAVSSERLADWNLLPARPDWADGLREEWIPGEAGAHERLSGFLDGALAGYFERRDVPGSVTTSRLSPHLAHGEITPFQVWDALDRLSGGDVEKFRKELAWREFSWHLLFHNPRLAEENYNRTFDDFPWRADADGQRAWQRGMTGYPVVDAGMRELWRIGWMHNRVRMVCASFLIKHLMVDWREGERWFWDTLVDADPANNPASWQWVAGSGADAAPYFRIFNPVLQGEKFDPDGAYVDRFVPELKQLPRKLVHRPWEASESELRRAGVKLGTDFPVPLVDHQRARDRALAAFKSLRGDA